MKIGQSAGTGIFLIFLIVVLFFVGAYGYNWLKNSTVDNSSNTPIKTTDMVKRPTPNEPLVFPDPIIIESGGETSFTVGFYNTKMTELQNVNVEMIDCDAFNPVLDTISTSVKGRDSHGFITKMKISEYEPNDYLCEINVFYMDKNSKKIVTSKEAIVSINWIHKKIYKGKTGWVCIDYY